VPAGPTGSTAVGEEKGVTVEEKGPEPKRERRRCQAREGRKRSFNRKWSKPTFSPFKQMIHYFIAYLGLNFNYMYHIINSRNMRKNIFILVCLIIVHVQKIEKK
jgi:hypothetical protein